MLWVPKHFSATLLPCIKGFDWLFAMFTFSPPDLNKGLSELYWSRLKVRLDGPKIRHLVVDWNHYHSSEYDIRD